ncbi:hypothetical protein V8E55_007508 [Tylopilus felleus]
MPLAADERTSNTGTSAFQLPPSAIAQNNATSTICTTDSRSAVRVAGTSRTDVFGRITSNMESAFTFTVDVGDPPLEQPKAPTTLAATPASINLPSVMAGTCTPAYSVTHVEEIPGGRFHGIYTSISAMPAHLGTSLEELRVQDYQQNRKTADAPGQTTSEAPAMPVSPFVTPTASAGSIFGGGTAGAVVFTTGQPVTGQFGAFGQ